AARAREEARTKGVLADSKLSVGHFLSSRRLWGASAHEVDHLYAIARLQAVLVVIRAADHFSVHLHRHAGADDAERIQEFTYRDPLRKLALLTVQPDLHRSDPPPYARLRIAGFRPSRNARRRRSTQSALRACARAPAPPRPCPDAG